MLPNIPGAMARYVIQQLGSHGTAPECGFEYYSVGLDDYLRTIEKECLQDFVRPGGSTFKWVIGAYGGGKTHFLYSVRDLAWRNGLAVSYVSLSHAECPFSQLELVYQAIVKGLSAPQTHEELMSGWEKGLNALLQRTVQTYAQRQGVDMSTREEREQLKGALIGDLRNLESISYAKALRSALVANIDGDEDAYETVVQWLLGEAYFAKIHRPYGILERIDRRSAFGMIRSLLQAIRQLGYGGLLLLLDEAEAKVSLSTKEVNAQLSNLRELIDWCGHPSFQGAMIFYAVPDDAFLDQGRAATYEALRQRVRTVFETRNPSGVRVDLSHLGTGDDKAFLEELGVKIAGVFAVARDHLFDEHEIAAVVPRVADTALERRFEEIGHRRLFVQMMVSTLEFLHRERRVPTDEEAQELWR